jgi:hypothetical protein
MSSNLGADFSGLFKEKNLWQIYRQGPPFYEGSAFNGWVVFGTLALLAAFACEHLWWQSGHPESAIDPRDIFLSWANVGISFTGTILGFLLAGFAVLFTLFKPETLLRLQQVTRPGKKLPELKLLVCVFIDVFVHYLAFLFWCILVLVVGYKNGPATVVSRSLGTLCPAIPSLVTHAVLVLWGTWFVLLVVKLKSFIYNLHQSLLLAVADSVD